MGKIVCFGESLIDMLAEPPPQASAAATFVQHAGGAPANAAVAAARLGADSHFVGMLGEDMFGHFLARSLRAAGVRIDGVAWTDRARTALAFVALDAHGERSFSFYRPPSADLLFTEADFQPESFIDLDAFHVCSNSLTEADIAEATCIGMQRAREAGAVVSMDLNWRPMLWSGDIDPMPRLWRALELADVVKLAREELAMLAGRWGEGGEARVVERLLEGRAQCVLVTDGAAPLAWYTRDGHGQMPAYPVRVVDSTGAGDAFVGGLLAALTGQGVRADGLADWCGDDQRRGHALRQACATGALAVTRKGAFAGMPGRTEVQQLMSSSGESQA